MDRVGWIGSGRVCLIYAAADGRACWTIYGGRGSPWPPYGLWWVRCAACLARGLRLFSTFFNYFHLGLDMGVFARTVGGAARSLTVQQPPTRGRYSRCGARERVPAIRSLDDVGMGHQLVMQPHSGTVHSPSNADD